MNPAIPFQQGDMLSLGGIAPDAFGGIAAFYSIVHIPRSGLVSAFREWRRILCCGGVLLVAFHIGDEAVRKEEWWGGALEEAIERGH